MLHISSKSLVVDLAGGLSKPAPSLVRMGSQHRTIRTRAVQPRLAPVSAQRRVSDEALDSAEVRYRAGVTLRAIANDVGLNRRRLASLLRERGVRLRGTSPSPAEIREMARHYQDGESLERVGTCLRFSASTVRSHLIIVGVTLRDPQGRQR